MNVLGVIESFIVRNAYAEEALKTFTEVSRSYYDNQFLEFALCQYNQIVQGDTYQCNELKIGQKVYLPNSRYLLKLHLYDTGKRGKDLLFSDETDAFDRESRQGQQCIETLLQRKRNVIFPFMSLQFYSLLTQDYPGTPAEKCDVDLIGLRVPNETMTEADRAVVEARGHQLTEADTQFFPITEATYTYLGAESELYTPLGCSHLTLCAGIK